MEKEQSREIFDSCFRHFNAFDWILFCTNALIIFALFVDVTYPRDPISKGRSVHWNPESSMSDLISVYFNAFLWCATCMLLSKLQVSSSSQTVFLLLFISTRSGLEGVTRMSGGIVLPLMSNPGMSAYTSKLSGLFPIMTLARWFSTESWRKLYLPWVKTQSDF